MFTKRLRKSHSLYASFWIALLRWNHQLQQVVEFSNPTTHLIFKKLDEMLILLKVLEAGEDKTMNRETGATTGRQMFLELFTPLLVAILAGDLLYLYFGG